MDKTNLANILDEQWRRSTFKTWPFESHKKCNANKMAEAGFIFIGSSVEPDSTICFFCSKSLDGWEANDDPWSEHLKHSPQCEYAQMQKSPQDWTLGEFLSIVERYESRLIDKEIDKWENRLQKFFN
ncbi:hypothetical protein ABEB36_001353 [Hypothenemus hampei]|uniref:Uncharacterized protein n=1 Tax=Hypothenemus hampei TaxID=57062 RepID=A0ABD1FEC7_HYPHA